MELEEAIASIIRSGMGVDSRDDRGLYVAGSKDGSPLLTSTPDARYLLSGEGWAHTRYFAHAREAAAAFLEELRR